MQTPANRVPRSRQGGIAQQRLDIQLSLALAALRVETQDSKSVHVVARQLIDPERPHPFKAAGNKEFNCLLWRPPTDQRASDIPRIPSRHSFY
jgi:hypothetical protein